MSEILKVPVTQQYIYYVQGKPIIMIPITTLMQILNELFISNLNTCQSKNKIQEFFFDENRQIKLCDYIIFLCRRFPISEEFFEDFARQLWQELPMDLAKKISPQKNQTLNINFIGKGDYDVVDTSEENQLTDLYKNLIDSGKFSYNISNCPFLNEDITIEINLPTLIDNGSAHGTRHTLHSEKMLLINAQKFFSQKNEKMWDIKDFYPLIDSLKNKEYLIPIDKDGNITILHKNKNKNENEDYELNECGQKILDFFHKILGISEDFIKNLIKELAKKMLNKDDYNINKIKSENNKTKEQIINDLKSKYLDNMLIAICEINNNSKNKKTLDMKDFYQLKFDLREYNIPTDNDGNITILHKNNDDYELNKCGQKILEFFYKISGISEISIKGLLIKLAKETLSINGNDYNINKIKPKTSIAINDAKIAYVEDIIIGELPYKLNTIKLNLPKEIYNSILSKQPDILKDDEQIQNELFGPIHLIQCVFYTCMLYCIDKDDEIKRAVITKIIKIRDDFQTIEKFEESEYTISKINLSAGIDMVSCMLHLIFNDCPNFAPKEIENIKNITMYLYDYFFPSNVQHVTQYNFLKLNNENRTYNDGVLIPETGEFCFPLPILYEKVTGEKFPIHIDMANGNQKIYELKLYEFQIPITEVDADTINCLEVETIVKNLNILKENLKYLDEKKFFRCLEYIVSLNCSLTEKQEMLLIFFPCSSSSRDSEIDKLSFDQILKYHQYIDIDCFIGIDTSVLKKWNKYITNNDNLQEDFVKKFFCAFTRSDICFNKFCNRDLLSNLVKYQDLIDFKDFFDYPSIKSDKMFFLTSEDYEKNFLKYLNQNKSDSNVCRLIVNEFFATKYFEKYLDDSEIWSVYKNCDPELFAKDKNK